MNDDAAPVVNLAGRAGDDPAAIAALYDGWALTRYESDLVEWGYDAPERVAERLVAAEIPGDEPVLDAGCGTGLVGVALRQHEIEPIVGGDFSSESVEVARSRDVYSAVVDFDLNGPLDFADGEFRATVSVGVFSYLIDTEATVRELLRVTRPGGVVIFTQRSDLWDERDVDGILDRVAGRMSSVSVSGPQPYLPGNPEFGDRIGIRYVTLTL
jgi:predicted TPR repeat methyltransferase